MVDPDGAGFTYYVSDEQLKTFASLTPEQRLTWLDEARDFSVRTAPKQARRSWNLLRRCGTQRYELWSTSNTGTLEFTIVLEDDDKARALLSKNAILVYVVDAQSFEQALSWQAYALSTHCSTSDAVDVADVVDDVHPAHTERPA